MSDINFQPIFDYIDETNRGLEQRLIDKIESELRDVKTAVANLSSQVKNYHEEMMVANHRLERLEKWAEQVGQKVGVPIVF